MAAVASLVDVAPGMKAGVVVGADLRDKSLDSKVYIHRMSLEAQILLAGCWAGQLASHSFIPYQVFTMCQIQGMKIRQGSCPKESTA